MIAVLRIIPTKNLIIRGQSRNDVALQEVDDCQPWSAEMKIRLVTELISLLFNWDLFLFREQILT